MLFLVFLLSVSFSCIPKSDTSNLNYDDPELADHSKKEVVVFVYHRFGNAKYPSTNISIDDFEKHLIYLKSNKYTVLNFGDAVDYINNPQTPYMEHVACITVDDGYKTFGSNAIPLLNKYEFASSLFINSESVGGGSFMDWDDLREVKNNGVEIGNHSHSHAYFLNFSKDERIKIFKEDLLKCQEKINQHLGFYPEVFAYPYGEFDPEMKDALKSLGFKASAAQNSGVMYAHDNYAIPRFPMAGSYTKLEGFIEKANMKAFRVKNTDSESFLLNSTNPPSITIEFDTSGVDLSRFNCFTPGECESSIDGNFITIKAQNKLTARRTLYKITAPAKEGKGWYWFSHLWTQPYIKE